MRKNNFYTKKKINFNPVARQHDPGNHGQWNLCNIFSLDSIIFRLTFPIAHDEKNGNSEVGSRGLVLLLYQNFFCKF